MNNQRTRKVGLFRRINWKPVRFVQLFIFVILTLLLSPFLIKTPLLSALVSIFFLNILIVSLSFAGFDVRRRWPLIVLWLMGTLPDWIAAKTGNLSVAMTLYIFSDLARAILLIASVVLILRYVLKSHEVTLDTIFGAIVAYFLIAVTFSCLYQAVAVFEPASFSIPGITGGGHSDSLKIQLAYFSYVTIATLGYGDIVPKLPVTQTLAILEAVIGQFYMAGVIAWLVSGYTRRGRDIQGNPGSETRKMECTEKNNARSTGVKGSSFGK
jgi:Ion channel